MGTLHAVQNQTCTYLPACLPCVYHVGQFYGYDARLLMIRILWCTLDRQPWESVNCQEYLGHCVPWGGGVMQIRLVAVAHPCSETASCYDFTLPISESLVGLKVPSKHLVYCINDDLKTYSNQVCTCES